MTTPHQIMPSAISIPVASVGALIIAAVGWSSSYFGSQYTQAAAVAEVNSRIDLLCNDYGQTVSRVDQNLQAIGQALKVPVVIGQNGSNPCKK